MWKKCQETSEEVNIYKKGHGLSNSINFNYDWTYTISVHKDGVVLLKFQSSDVHVGEECNTEVTKKKLLSTNKLCKQWAQNTQINSLLVAAKTREIFCLMKYIPVKCDYEINTAKPKQCDTVNANKCLIK